MSSVLITGCSTGIGRVVAVELAARGHRVVATARRPETLADLPVAQRLALDVTDDASVVEAVRQAGELDAVVNNAGQIFLAPVEDIPIKEIQRLFDVNTLGALRVTQAVLPGMRRRGHGRVLFMSSWSGRIAFPFQSAYGASKWALEAIAEALSAEVRDFGISVSLLEPGPVSSGALDSPQRFFSDDTYLRAASRKRGGVMITPEELATATADALESDRPALRIPVGAAAVELLTRRRQGDDRLPFPATLTQ